MDTPAAAPARPLIGIKGWLRILVIQLLVLVPLRSALSLAGTSGGPTLQAMRELRADLTKPDQIMQTLNHPRFRATTQAIYRRDGYVFYQIDQVVFGLVGLLAGLAICQRSRSAYVLMRTFVIASTATGLLVLAFGRAGHQPTQVVLFGAFVVWWLLWWLYFERSRRVRETLGMTPRSFDGPRALRGERERDCNRLRKGVGDADTQGRVASLPD